MIARSRDTTAAVEQQHLALLRQISPARRLRQWSELTRMVRVLSAQGLVRRTGQAHTHALITMWYGEQLAWYVPDAAGRRSAMSTEPLSVLSHLGAILDRCGIDYLVVGSLASTVHGVSRSTLDADLLLDLRPSQASALSQALADTFIFAPEDLATALVSGDGFNIIHRESLFKVDFFIRATPFDDTQFQRRIAVAIDEHSRDAVWFASAEDTILAKLRWYDDGGRVSERQWRDVLGIVTLQAGALDWAYLRAWAATLALGDLLAAVERDTGQ